MTSASDAEIHGLEAIVNEKLATLVPPGRPLPSNALLLAAMALAHDLESSRAQARETASQAKLAFARVLGRVDALLEQTEPSHVEDPSSEADDQSSPSER